MTNALSAAEIDELLLKINIDDRIDSVDTSGASIHAFYKRFAQWLRDFLAALLAANVSLEKFDRAEPPCAGEYAFPDRRFAIIDVGKPGMRFLVTLGDAGMARLLSLVGGEGFSPPSESATLVVEADIYQRIAAITERAFLSTGCDAAAAGSIVFPLTDEALQGETWAPGFAIPLSMKGLGPLDSVPAEHFVLSIYPSQAIAEVLVVVPEAADQPRENTAYRVKIYDFGRPDKFSSKQMRNVRNIHETFARLTTASLSASLRTLVSMRVVSVDQLTYEEFIRSIPSTTTLAVVNVAPLKGQMILESDPALTFTIIDRIFGGAGDRSNLTRELTDIEHSVMEVVMAGMIGNLHEAWRPYLDLRPGISQIVANSRFTHLVPPIEMVLLVKLETRIGDVESMMNLCIPYPTIMPIFSKLATEYWNLSVTNDTSRKTLIPEDEIRALKATRYASFSPSKPGLTARDLEARLSGGLRIEMDACGSFEYKLS